MDIVNQIFSSADPLLELLGDYETNHIGFVYGMNFKEALVLTNDAWKARVAGVPHNGFLVGAAFNPERLSQANEFDREVLLLRVLGPASLPTDADLVRTRVEHNQRRTEADRFPADERDGLDVLTHGELQYGALTCRILGTFYLENGELKLGSDIENYVSSSRLRVFKPRGKALAKIVNHVNAATLEKALEEAKKSGFSELPPALEIGTVRYTSTDRLHRGGNEEKVPVCIQPSDFLARRTAILGMTRTGKSNTVKTTVAAVALAAARGGIKVGQIIFDLNGEYANANHQDDGSSIADVFDTDCVRYRAVNTPGFADLRTNFYEEPAQGLTLIQDLFHNEVSTPYSGQDLETVMGSSLEEPDPTDRSAHTRWKVLVAVWKCILAQAGYAQPPGGLMVDIPLSDTILKQINSVAAAKQMTVQVPTNKRVPVQEACEWFETIRQFNRQIREDQKESKQPTIGLKSSSGKSWVDPTLEAFLNFLVRENSAGRSFGGYRAIVNYTNYHSPRRAGDVVEEILKHLYGGKIVILDLSVGPVSVRKVLSKKIAARILASAMDIVSSGSNVTPPNIVIYVEEAHNLVDRKADLVDTWPRIAKEGAKFKIAFVYATQEPSSIHPNILANTENWFVTHLNNDDELRALSKYYDFGDFQESLKRAQDVGFARIKSLSSPFVVPTQIKRFTPAELKNELASIKVARVAAANSRKG